MVILVVYARPLHEKQFLTLLFTVELACRAHVDFVFKLYIEMSAIPRANDVLKMLIKVHFWKKIRMFSIDEKITILIKKRVSTYSRVDV